MTISTIGYGDVPPQNDGERVFTIVGMAVGASTYAFVVGSVVSILASLSERADEQRAAIDRLNRFINEARLPPALGRQLRSYYRYAQLHVLTKKTEWSAILEDLSPGLRGITALAIHSSWMDSVRLLRLAPAGVSVELAFAFSAVVYPPDECLALTNSRAEQLTVLSRGLVLVVRNNRLWDVLGEHGVLGEELLRLNRRVPHATMTLCFVQAHTISRERLLAILGRHPVFARQAHAWSARSLVKSTVIEMTLALRRVQACAAPAAREPRLDELIAATFPLGLPENVDSYSLLTPALRLFVVARGAPIAFFRIQRAARVIRRAWLEHSARHEGPFARPPRTLSSAGAAVRPALPFGGLTPQKSLFDVAPTGRGEAEPRTGSRRRLDAGRDARPSAEALAAAVSTVMVPALAALQAEVSALRAEVAGLRRQAGSSPQGAEQAIERSWSNASLAEGREARRPEKPAARTPD
jgi:hypothetical protein